MTSFDDDDYFSGDFDGLSLDLDESGQAWQVYGGYRFMKYFAVEGRYTDFGDYTTDIKIYGEKVGDITADFSALSVHGIGILPMGGSGFDFYGQLGFGLISYEGKTQGYDESDDATTFSLGVGARYTPPSVQAMTVQLAYDIYMFQVEEEFTGDTYDQSLSMVKLGIQYNF